MNKSKKLPDRQTLTKIILYLPDESAKNEALRKWRVILEVESRAWNRRTFGAAIFTMLVFMALIFTGEGLIELTEGGSVMWLVGGIVASLVFTALTIFFYRRADQVNPILSHRK